MSVERILVVDDEPQIQRFLKPALSAAGYDILEAMTGAEALKAAATSAPDVVILDLGLPDMDGKEVIANLRGWSQVPIIILSARDQESEKIAALGFDYGRRGLAQGFGRLLSGASAGEYRARCGGE